MNILQRMAREPYRFFFPLAVFWGLAGVGHWLAYAAGWLPGYSGYAHASVQIQGYMACFVFGFLLTAVPRFTASEPCSLPEFLFFAAAFTAGPFFHLMKHGRLQGLAGFSGALLLFMFFAGSRFRQRSGSPVRPPVEFIWIPVALLHAAAGAAFLAASELGRVPPVLMLAGRPLLEQGFLLSIVLGIGGFLGPRLMGVYSLAAPGGILTMEKEASLRRRKISIHAAAGLLLFLTFFLEAAGHVRAAYVLRAALVTGVFLMTRSLVKQPLLKDGFVRLLWISFWMVTAGYWVIAAAPDYRVVFLHLVFIGGYSLMTFAVGTMVMLSHAGRAQALRKPLWILRVTGGCVLTALAVRIAAAFFAEHYFPLIGVSASLWLAAAACWLVFSIRLAAVFPDPEAVLKHHEEAKRRVMECRSEGC